MTFKQPSENIVLQILQNFWIMTVISIKANLQRNTKAKLTFFNLVMNKGFNLLQTMFYSLKIIIVTYNLFTQIYSFILDGIFSLYSTYL